MDLKALMQKLELINSKQNLMESEKKETTWADKSGKKHPATQVKGDKYTGKEAEKESKKKTDEGIVFNSSIAQMLLREFGLEEAPIANPYKDPAQAAKFAAMSPADQAWLTKGGGVPDINDEIILSRAPNKGKPAAPAVQRVDPNQADRDDAEQGAAMRANAAGGNSTSAATGVGIPGEEAAAQAAAGGQAASPAAPAPTGTTAQGDDDGNTMITKPDGTTQVVGPDGNAIKPGTNPALATNKAQAAAIASGAQDDVTGVDKAVAANAAAPAGGQAASPAAPAKPAAAKPAFKADPVGQSIANQLKMTTPDAIKLFQKNNGLQADGMIGPATTKALQAAAQKMGVTTTSGVGTSTAGAGRGGQGGPTATQMAQAPAAGGQAASPAANPKAAEIDAQLAKYKKYPGSNAQIIARLEKEKAALTGGSTQTPAQQAVSKDLGSFAGESVRYQDDEILARIKSAFRF